MNRVMALCALVIVCIISWLMWWPAAGVPILAYHQVSPADEIYSVTGVQFEEQMSYLQEQGYTPINLQQLFDSYDGKGSLPDKPIIITFDDGYEDNLLAALPIMEKYNMRSTVFIITDMVGTSEYVSWQQIAEMQARNTEIGSHTMNHVGLGSVSADQQRLEILGSKKALEQHLGKPINFFAYPYGQFTPITQQLLREAGYRGACSGIAGLNSKGVDFYALKRVNVPHPRYGLWEFRLRLLRANLYSKLGI
ncbi:MAG: polysaccharide deacetylase family protein [Sporomusaceae bacterium]|nr:polysaccharide deacetylase family protein [Sporomusaceae bacterium]